MTGMGKLRKLRDKWQTAYEAAGRWQTAVMVILVVVIAAGLATYAAAASYDTVSRLAASYNVALPRLNPIGIDGGLAGIIILDIAVTWLAEPIWWLRFAVRLFAAGMIGANAAAGWPRPVGVGLRIAAPVLFVIITEAGRTILLRRKHRDERKRKAAERTARRAARERRRKDRIPLVRWWLDPKGTWALWKRMRLWREPSYRAAVNMELERLAAIEKLAMKYGAEQWEAKAPADLVWMLKSGVRMAEALERVAELTKPEPVPEPVPATAPVIQPKRSPQKSAARSGTARKTAPADDLAMEARALELLATDLTMSGAELARRLEVSPSYGRKLRRRLTRQPPPTEPAQDRPAKSRRTAPQDRPEDR